MRKPVFVTAQQAAEMIEDNKTIATIGMTLVSASESILKAIEQRFLETGSPNNLRSERPGPRDPAFCP